MRIFHEMRYPSSNLFEICTQRIFSSYSAGKLGHMDGCTHRKQTDRRPYRQMDADNDNTPAALWPRCKNNPSLVSSNLILMKRSNCNKFQGSNFKKVTRNAKKVKVTFWSIMRIFHEMRYLSSNLFEICTQRIFSSFSAGKLGHMDGCTHRKQTDRRPYRQMDADNDNTPAALWPRCKNNGMPLLQFQFS